MWTLRSLTNTKKQRRKRSVDPRLLFKKKRKKNLKPWKGFSRKAGVKRALFFLHSFPVLSFSPLVKRKRRCNRASESTISVCFLSGFSPLQKIRICKKMEEKVCSWLTEGLISQWRNKNEKLDPLLFSNLYGYYTLQEEKNNPRPLVITRTHVTFSSLYLLVYWDFFSRKKTNWMGWDWCGPLVYTNLSFIRNG